MFDLINKQGLIAHDRRPSGRIHKLDWGSAADKPSDQDSIAKAKARNLRHRERIAAIAKELGITSREVIRRKLHHIGRDGSAHL